MITLIGMNSGNVNRRIKNEIWPLLRKSGFSAFSTRTTWRYTPEQIHVVNFQSFNSYLAEGLGCTTFSFGLNLGIYFTAIPAFSLATNHKDSESRPQEYQCHFRHHPLKRFDQSEFPRRDIWYIETDGLNLPEVIADARTVVEMDALPWFDRFRSMEEVLRLLVEEDDLEWFHGKRQSPNRKYCTGHIALRLGQVALAEPMIAEANQELERIHAKFTSRRRSQKPRD